MIEILKSELLAHKSAFDGVDDRVLDDVLSVANTIIHALKNGKKVLIFGNGGSAADAQHFAAELSGRYKTERKGLAGLALSTDTSALTAIGNDYGYEEVFARQVEALANSGDVAFGISTSGTSKNIIKALQTAKDIGCECVLLASQKLQQSPYTLIKAPSTDTPRIQEFHIFTIHSICELVDRAFE